METYLGDWIKVINTKKLVAILSILNKDYNKNIVTPNKTCILKAFKLCPLSNTKIVIISQDPYPQKGVATGIAFGNSLDTPENKVSPSLRLLKDSIINFEKSHNSIIFDNSLESWCKQGVLMLNSSLTTEINKPGSHSLLWREFMIEFITKLSTYNPGTIYLLLGSEAKGLRRYINEKFNYVFEYTHPSYHLRTNIPFNINIIFEQINKIFYDKYGYSIEWYKEETI